MATVFMKWLERRPKDYDRGIGMLTLGRLERLKKKIADVYVKGGERVLEIGCGTGALSAIMGEKGAQVTAIDASPAMLAEAEEKVRAAGLEERVTLKYLDAVMIGEEFQGESFDVIVSTLVFSELPGDLQKYVLAACKRLLAPGGRMVIVDEVIPDGFFIKLSYYLVRLPLALVTWLVTRTTTSPLRGFGFLLAQAGYKLIKSEPTLMGSLVLFVAEVGREDQFVANAVGVLAHKVTIKTLLADLYALFFRMIPPYPKVRPGLYKVGEPAPDSPVLVTGNYTLTVRRLVKAIDGEVNAWVVVADSAGINVWCASGGRFFTADKVIAAVKTSGVERVVKHHSLILPQLCANGVDGWRVREETGWGVHWGPVKAADIPGYLAANKKKSDKMRQVAFPLKDRLEMVTVTLGFYGLMILVPLAIFWREMFWPISIALVSLSYFYAIFHPWLPGEDGLVKSIPMTVITLLGFFTYTQLINPLPPETTFRWGVGLVAMAVFTAGELQGMSPRMRGEQANWGWEGVTFAILGLLYWLVPLGMGWR
ncbi:MAG: methyltransferase domain-containing protein [Anaerolineales bacterium]|jgi:ubiquinone/menaquinone biosynthesis C-methylase UbiE